MYNETVFKLIYSQHRTYASTSLNSRLYVTWEPKYFYFTPIEDYAKFTGFILLQSGIYSISLHARNNLQADKFDYTRLAVASTDFLSVEVINIGTEESKIFVFRITLTISYEYCLFIGSGLEKFNIVMENINQ